MTNKHQVQYIYITRSSIQTSSSPLHRPDNEEKLYKRKDELDVIFN